MIFVSGKNIRRSDARRERICRRIINRLIERDDLQKMRSAIADIAEIPDEIIGKFALQTEVVLLNIRRLQFGINKHARNRQTDDRHAD